MPYSQAWNESTPVGSTTLASDIDLVFRNLKRDLRERHNEWAVDFTADPVLPKSQLVFVDNSQNSTGTAGSEQNIGQYVVPAGRIGAEGAIRIKLLYNIVNTAGGTKRLRIKLSTTSFFDFTYGAGDALAFGFLELVIANKANAAQQVGGGFYTALSGVITGAPRVTGVIDTTVAQNLDITGEISINGDAVRTDVIQVEILRLA